MGHILVVDDEPAIVAVVRERMEREGFSERAVATGEDALSHTDRAVRRNVSSQSARWISNRELVA
jgi:CheY-like chemotaxis protein